MALVAGAIAYSGGVGAAFSDQDVATANIEVGTLSCAFESSDPHVHVHSSTNKHTATVTLDKILTSTGSQTADIAVRNTGSIPLTTSWTASGGLGDLGPTVAPSGATLPVGAAQDVQIGFEWTDLSNWYMGKSATAKFTVDCAETPNGNLQFDVRGSAVSAEWTNDGTIKLTSMVGGEAVKIHFGDLSGGLPAVAPTWAMDGDWHGGAPGPVLYIKFTDPGNTGTGIIYGYPSQAGGGYTLGRDFGTTPVNSDWSTVFGALTFDPADAVIIDSSILFNPTIGDVGSTSSPFTSTVTCVQYKESYLVGGSPTC